MVAVPRCRRLSCASFVLAITCCLSSGAASAQLAFTDQTAAAGLVAVHDPATPMVFSPYLTSKMVAGGAVGDFDNDGYEDVLVLVSGGGPDKFFINNQDGTFTEAAAEWGLGEPHMGIGAAVGDYDGNGFLDIYVTSGGPATGTMQPGGHRLYHNNGNGTFTETAIWAGVAYTSPNEADGFGSAFGDYDLDGDLDLFVTGWLYQSEGNRLFRNNGNGTFTDVTVAAGVHDLSIRGFSPCFVDMNGDRYPELLIAADYQTSRYFVNNGNGTFTDATSTSNTGLDDNGMGHTVGDFNGNGRLDWYVTSIYSPGGTGMPSIPGTGNMLYLNSGNDQYLEWSGPARVNDGGWGWGTVSADWDHNGWLDLAETNGWLMDSMPEWENEPCYLWTNSGFGLFDEIAGQCGLVHTGLGRGMVNFDYDLDGDQDILVFSNNDTVKLFRNDLSGPATNWLRILLDTSADADLAPHGFGSRVEMTVGGVDQVRSINGGSNYLSQSELSAHFGLGAATFVDEVRVIWNDGRVTRLPNVAANQVLTITPQVLTGDLNCDGAVDGRDVAAFSVLVIDPASYDAAHPDCDAAAGDLNGDGSVNAHDEALFVAMLVTGAPVLPGDLNGDGATDAVDLPRFVDVLLNPESASGLDLARADVNGDAMVNGTDVPSFVGCLLGGSCPP